MGIARANAFLEAAVAYYNDLGATVANVKTDIDLCYTNFAVRITGSTSVCTKLTPDHAPAGPRQD